MLMEKRGTASRHIMDRGTIVMEMTPFLKFRHCVEIMGRGTIVMEMTLHNVFVKPDELSPSLLEGSAMAITDDKPRGEAEFTQTIPRREGRRRKSKRRQSQTIMLSRCARLSIRLPRIISK